MRLSNRIRILSAAGLLGLAACTGQPQNLALLAPDDLYARAQAALEAGKYGGAIPLLEAFTETHLGDPRASQARFDLARAHLQRREYISAITHYQRFVNDFPGSPLQIDARFGICQAYERLSPRPPLDQEHTRSALIHCQSVAQYYPGTEQGTQAEAYATDMRLRLARKSYETGMYYFRRRAYDAAVLYLEEVVLDYPDTSLAPTALRQLADTYSIMGYVEEADAARERLRREYPDSPEAQGLRA